MSIILTKNAMGIELGLSLGVASRFKLRVFKPDSGFTIHESGWSKNIVPTRGLDVCLSGGTHTSGDTSLRCQLGTGSSPTTMGDTGLQAPFGPRVAAHSSALSFQTSVAPFWRKSVCVFRFLAGVFNNTNISEVATFEAFGSQHLYNRALIVDGAGNPTVVSVAADEALDVIWEHFVVSNPQTGTFNQVIDGVSTAFNFSIGPAAMVADQRWASWSSARSAPSVNPDVQQTTGSCQIFHSCTGVGAPTGFVPQGGVNNGWLTSTTGSPAFVPGSGVRNFRLNVPLDQGNNVNGINGFHFNMRHHFFNMVITPAVMKVATKVYRIEVQAAMANTALPE